jgi:hypothetical protein
MWPWTSRPAEGDAPCASRDDALSRDWRGGFIFFCRVSLWI